MFSIETLFIAFSLSMDAFAVSVSIAISSSSLSWRQKFRLFFHFGLFQFLFPLIGYYSIEVWHLNLESYSGIVAGLILVFLGIKMAMDGVKDFNGKSNIENNDLTRGFSLVLFSSGVSIDALSVGISFALIKKSIWGLSILAGVITGFVSFLALEFAERIKVRIDGFSKLFGGLVLIILGIKTILF